MGFTVSVLKVDMYLNIDAGTINPLEHGEVFVTKDGVPLTDDLKDALKDKSHLKVNNVPGGASLKQPKGGFEGTLREAKNPVDRVKAAMRQIKTK